MIGFEQDFIRAIRAIATKGLVDKQGNVFKSSFTPVERQQTVRFDMKASTDISSPETSAASHSLPAYDLMGRRLLQPAAGQLYIVKGKKFFVK